MKRLLIALLIVAAAAMVSERSGGYDRSESPPLLNPQVTAVEG
jgi:hypothetical protein